MLVRLSSSELHLLYRSIRAVSETGFVLVTGLGVYETVWNKVFVKGVVDITVVVLAVFLTIFQ